MSDDPKRLAGDDRVGTRFGEYQIDSLIGVGGMGRVYRATAGDGAPVALKVVKEDLARDETFRRRFRREARIAQTVRNPHVVPVRDTGEQDGLPYLAAQFIEGVALDRKLELEGRLDLATTVQDLRAGRRRAAGAVGGGHGAPRRQAREHPARPGGERVHHRLRARQGSAPARCSRDPASRWDRWTTCRQSRSAVSR